MSLFLGGPRPGDWVRTIRPVKVTFTDHLLGSDAGLKPGTRGVILRHLGGDRYEARLDTGAFGSVTATVRGRQVRIIRRGGGVEAFAARAGRLRAARAGVGLALLAPLLHFVASWYLGGGDSAGLLVALLDGVVASALGLLSYALAQPGRALVYVLFACLAWRFAFR